MNKEQYASVLERQLTREDNEKEKAAQQKPVYKAVIKTICKLEKEISKLIKHRDNISHTKNWSERRKVVDQFKTEWDDMSLILNKDKRTKEKQKLLKKYLLFR